MVDLILNKLSKKISYRKKFGWFWLLPLLTVVLLVVFVFVLLLLILVSVSSLKIDATFNIDLILFTIGFTSFTIGMASLTTPNVFEVLLRREDQFILLVIPLTPLVPPNPSKDFIPEVNDGPLVNDGILLILKPLFIIGIYDGVGIIKGPPI